MTPDVSENEVQVFYLAYCGDSLESTLLYTTRQKRLGAIKFINL